ncbi:MAG: tetratricopeptide repeat protein [Cyclobacteriaceae bacterium]
MRKLTLVILLFLTQELIGSPESLETLRKQSISYLHTNVDSAEILAQKLQFQGKEENNHYAIVQSYFILGWLQSKKHKNYGRGIIYYLEGIRHAESNPYEGVEETLISLNKNIGFICNKFKNHEGSLKYHQDALKYADMIQNNIQAIGILVNIAISYRNQQEYEMALEFFDKAIGINRIQGNKEKELDINNEIGNTQIQAKQYDIAINTFKNNLRLTQSEDYNYPSFRSYALANIAECFYNLNEYEIAAEWYKKSIAFKDSINLNVSNPWSYFISLKGYADSQMSLKNYNEALKAYKQAESIANTDTEFNQEYFDVYKSLALLFESTGDFKLANDYNKIHAEKLDQHIILQQKVEQIDKNYNLELITQRYYSLVAQQEKNEKIELYGALTALAFILTVVLFVLISNYREKNLKRQLEKSIRVLNIQS